MGKFYDSSNYRVVPLVEAIKNNASNFATFLKTINGIPDLIPPDCEKDYFYGDHEKQLKPPKDHLECLIRYLSAKNHANISVGNSKRAALYGANGGEEQKRALEEAIECLNEVYNEPILPKAWYIFEGASNPDIYIEGEDYVIVCEGKWTESHITEKTTHLKDKDEFRNQMIRHIQGALNVTDKKVYAFYIVDENCNYRDDLTKPAMKSQLEKETIVPRDPAKILDSFYGFTTWQELERMIPSLRFFSKEELDQLRQ